MIVRVKWSALKQSRWYEYVLRFGRTPCSRRIFERLWRIDQYGIDHTPCGLSIREDENPITGNTSRFLPHAIV